MRDEGVAGVGLGLDELHASGAALWALWAVGLGADALAPSC